MPVSEAKALFKTFGNFGIKSRADDNETTFAMIRNSGAVFIPLTAYRQGGKSLLKEWGIHGNYTTSSRSGGSVLHVRITPFPIDGVHFDDWTDKDQGCASRLVQNY